MLLSPFIRQQVRTFVSSENAQDLAATGIVTPAVDRTFVLEEAAKAIRHLEDGRALGNVVVTVDRKQRGTCPPAVGRRAVTLRKPQMASSLSRRRASRSRPPGPSLTSRTSRSAPA